MAQREHKLSKRRKASAAPDNISVSTAVSHGNRNILTKLTGLAEAVALFQATSKTNMTNVTRASRARGRHEHVQSPSCRAHSRSSSSGRAAQKLGSTGFRIEGLGFRDV